MKRIVPILILCAVFLAGCGMGGTASSKGEMELTSSEVVVTKAPKITTTTFKDGRKETVVEPPSVTARGPVMAIKDGDKVYYNWGFFRLQKLLGLDPLSAGLSEKPPRGELKGSPAISVVVTADKVEATVGATKGMSATGGSTKVSWLVYIMGIAGVIVFGIVLMKYGPKLLALLKAGWNILAAKIPWLPAVPVADVPKTKVTK